MRSTPNVINANKQAFVNAFVTRTEFRAIYDGLNNTQYVDSCSRRRRDAVGIRPAGPD